jgi:hypothetical protein
VKADIVVKFLVPTLGPNIITIPFNFYSNIVLTLKMKAYFPSKRREKKPTTQRNIPEDLVRQ